MRLDLIKDQLELYLKDLITARNSIRLAMTQIENNNSVLYGEITDAEIKLTETDNELTTLLCHYKIDRNKRLIVQNNDIKKSLVKALDYIN